MMGRGKLGRPAEPPVSLVEPSGKRFEGRTAGPFPGEIPRRGFRAGAPQDLHDLLGRPKHLPVAALPDALDAPDQLDHPHPAVTGLPRDVGAGKERLSVGGHENGQRPAAAARHDLADGHVDPVHVGPLLAVDLDADEELVQEARHLGILEGLAGHHVAPVARGVADGEEDGPVLRPGPLEGLV